MKKQLIDPAALERALAFAGETGTAQIAVLTIDEILASRTFSSDPVDVFAVQKGLFALMMGMAVDQGLLSLDDPVTAHLGTGWSNLDATRESLLTIRHVLTMTTGMDDELRYQGPPGEQWRYNNTAYNYLKRLLCEKTGLSLQALTDQWLSAPLGFEQTRWVERDAKLPDGRPLTGLLSTASDLAQIGLLVLRHGRWQDRQLVSAEFVEALAKPGSSDNPSWGLMWWNNHGSAFRVPMREERRHEGPIIPAAPPDLIAARGAMENHLAVIPSCGLIVARTATPAARGHRFEREFYQTLLGAG